MAGLLDEVMDGIAAKEKEEQTTPAQNTTPTTPPAADKGMHGYSDQFKEKYGERNGEKKNT
jgi:hypothetical protein